MTLSDQDFLAIMRILEELYRLQDLDRFAETAMRLVPPLVESELTGYNEVNYEARRMRCVMDSPAAQSFYHESQLRFESLMHQNPLIAHYAQVRDEPKKVSDFLSTEEWRRTKIYQDIYRHMQANYQIALVLPLKTQAIVAFAFNRSESDFTERHRAILTALQPHLTRAYENAVLHSDTLIRAESREDMLAARGAGWLDLDSSLKIQRAALDVLETIAQYYPDEKPRANRLPKELEQWIGEQQARLKAGQLPHPHVLTTKNQRLILRLVRGKRMGQLSLVTEAFQLSASPESLKDLGLTKRQAEILFWVSQGKSNSEVAVILKLSVSTVENHIHKIFKSLNLKNRTEAARLAQAYIAQSHPTGPKVPPNV